MSRKSWHLDRRTFLKGVGVAAAVPYLEAMAPVGRAPRGDLKSRLCYVYFPNGAGMPKEGDPKWGQWRWFPSGEGSTYEFTNTLESLAPHRSKLSLLGGLSHPLSRNLLGHLAGDTWLTAGDMRGDQYLNRISADQVAARHLGKHTRYRSLVLSTDGGIGYKSRIATLSFDDNGRPIPSEHRQRQIFERYFSPDGGATSDERRKSLRQGRKITSQVRKTPVRAGDILLLLVPHDSGPDVAGWLGCLPLADRGLTVTQDTKTWAAIALFAGAVAAQVLVSWVTAPIVPRAAALTGVPALAAMSIPSLRPLEYSRTISPRTG